jgi:hypothetical protein
MEGTQDGNSALNSMADAMAELDRRDAAREAEKPTAKTSTADQDEETDSSADPGADESEDVATEEDAAETETEEASVEFDGKTLAIPKGTPPELVQAVQKLGNDLKADYTRKTQAVAQERHVIEAAQKQTMAQAKQLQEVQTSLAQMAQDIIGTEPDLTLAQNDPQAYLVQKGMYEKRVGMFNRLYQQGQQLQAQQEEHVEKQRAEFRQREAEALLKQMPELASPEKFQVFRSKMVTVGEKYGFKPEELSAITDHRMVLALRDLARFQSGKDTAGDVKSKLANVAPKVSKPGSTQQGDAKQRDKADAFRKFKQSGGSDRALREYLARTS